MNKEREKIIDKAKKLKELADRGVDGEKETAKRMYDAYKKKHNLTDEDVQGHKYTEDFIKEFANMTDAQIIETIGKGLILLGVSLLFSFISDNVSSEGKAKRNSENSKRVNELNKMFSQFKNKNNKNNKPEKEEDIPNEEEQDEIQKSIDNILNNDKEHGA